MKSQVKEAEIRSEVIGNCLWSRQEMRVDKCLRAGKYFLKVYPHYELQVQSPEGWQHTVFWKTGLGVPGKWDEYCFLRAQFGNLVVYNQEDGQIWSTPNGEIYNNFYCGLALDSDGVLWWFAPQRSLLGDYWFVLWNGGNGYPNNTGVGTRIGVTRIIADLYPRYDFAVRKLIHQCPANVDTRPMEQSFDLMMDTLMTVTHTQSELHTRVQRLESEMAKVFNTIPRKEDMDLKNWIEYPKKLSVEDGGPDNEIANVRKGVRRMPIEVHHIASVHPETTA